MAGFICEEKVSFLAGCTVEILLLPKAMPTYLILKAQGIVRLTITLSFSSLEYRERF